MWLNITISEDKVGVFNVIEKDFVVSGRLKKFDREEEDYLRFWDVI